jgi:lipopolysaccharide export LptBFGC system permease protein LptF
VATPLVTVLLGLPFAFKVGRRGSMYGVGVGLILAIVFWAIAAISNALGLETILSPFLSAWAPNILFAAVGAYLLLFIPT